jgi:hypothetical protein
MEPELVRVEIESTFLVADEGADTWHVLDHILASLTCFQALDLYDEPRTFFITLLDGSVVEGHDLPLTLLLLHHVEGPNGKRGIPLLNFAGWITLSTGVTLAYQHLRTRGDATEAAESEIGGVPGAEQSAALLSLSYYLPAAVWALKRDRHEYILYSAPFATTLCAALKGRPAAS